MLKEPLLVQKQTIHQQKALNFSFNLTPWKWAWHYQEGATPSHREKHTKRLKCFVLEHSAFKTKHLKRLIRDLVWDFELLGLHLKWKLMLKNIRVWSQIMFLSLHQRLLKTKTKIPDFFVLIFVVVWKRKRPRSLSFFLNCDNRFMVFGFSHCLMQWKKCNFDIGEFCVWKSFLLVWDTK